MRVVFEAQKVFGEDVQQHIKEYYEKMIAFFASQILEPAYLEEVEAVIVPKDFISAVIEFQRDHSMGDPSVTDNEYGRAYGKMMQDPKSGKYFVFIDSSMATLIMEDQVFKAYSSNLDEIGYQNMVRGRGMAINILAHELSHVEFAIRVRRPATERSLYSGLIQQGYILLDEYFACRKAALFSKRSLADDDETFIIELEQRAEEDRCKYKTREIDLSRFCELFHSYTEMALIRLVSVIGAYHSENKNQLPFSNTKVGKQAQIFSDVFDQLFNLVITGVNPDIPEVVLNAIYDYYVDLGVQIEDTSRGLYYHIPD